MNRSYASPRENIASMIARAAVFIGQARPGIGLMAQQSVTSCPLGPLCRLSEEWQLHASEKTL